jgi:hypothetical protein
MAQNATTVTAPNPTPPTNLIFVGATPPLDLLQTAVDDGIPAFTGTLGSHNENAGGAGGPSRIAFTTSTAAAGSGTSATHEGRGTETSLTQSYGANIYAPIPLVMVGAGPTQNAASILAGPNATSASGAALLATPTITGSPAPNNVASGAGTVAITLTGTNYTPSSKVYIDGILQTSNYVSPTSLTVTNAPKRISAGTRSVVVTNGFNGPTSTASTWTFT